MDALAFLNGSLSPLADAKVSVLDRGFLFADGVYDVCGVVEGRLVDNEAHLARLDRSLKAVGIAHPYSTAMWVDAQKELVERNRLREGYIYMQVSRGAAMRDFAFPADAEPTTMMFTQPKDIIGAGYRRTGVSVVTVEDLRWKRRDIKSIALLPQVLARQAAVDAGAAEAWMVEDGLVTEGASSTAFIVDRGGTLVTRPLSTAVLPGITRGTVLRLARSHGMNVEERTYAVAEAIAASEAFQTSATSFVTPVVSIDGARIGSGQPGPATRRLAALYEEFATAALPAA